jgi:hypothetical protein
MLMFFIPSNQGEYNGIHAGYKVGEILKDAHAVEINARK